MATAASSRSSKVGAGIGASSRRSGTDLPPYEAPMYPITDEARRELDRLQFHYSVKKIEEHIKSATNILQASAVDINDRLVEREAVLKKQASRREAQDVDPTTEDERQQEELLEMRGKVENMTTRMDESMQRLIDNAAALRNVESSLRTVQQRSTFDTAMRGTTTQRTRTQRSERTVEDGATEPMATFDPTDPNNTATEQNQQSQPPTELTTLFAENLQKEKERYHALPLYDRYALNDDYRNFKRLVHDAQHGDDGPPLPRPQEWFAHRRAAKPGETRLSRNPHEDAMDEEEDESDIEIEREHISTKCPITLQEFRDPVTSHKCPHSFEREAIMELIRSSHPTAGTRGGAAAHRGVAQCPVAGCSERLSAKDLYADPLLVRKIQRLQRVREQWTDGEREANSLPSGTQVEELDSEGGEDIDMLDQMPTARSAREVKRERSSALPVR